jgi:hypothetical protein
VSRVAELLPVIDGRAGGLGAGQAEATYVRSSAAWTGHGRKLGAPSPDAGRR